MRKISALSILLFTFCGNSSFALTCTTTTVCDYVTASCSTGSAHNPLFPQTIKNLPFNYSMTDPNPPSSCTGNNGTVTCHGGTTTETLNVLPASSRYCTYTPSTILPLTVDCNYRTSSCTTACTSSHTVTTCI